MIIIMQNKSDRNRPLHYNNKTDMHSFVYGNPSQAVSASIPFAPQPAARTAMPHQQHTSLFDRYNRSNLYLRDCDQRDLTCLTKNIVMHQECLSGELADCIARKSAEDRSRNSRNMHKGSPGIADPLLRTAPQVSSSRQYAQNEVFFNYKEMGDMKKKQKQGYLTAIEQMVKDAENQISEIEQLQEEEKMEIGHINKQHREIEQQASNAFRVGVMQQQIAAVGVDEDEDQVEVMHIHEQMEPREINQILEEHHKMNDDILERASRARSKEFKSSKGNFGMSMTQGQKLGATMKKSMGPTKSVISTMKDGFKGKKGRK